MPTRTPDFHYSMPVAGHCKTSWTGQLPIPTDRGTCGQAKKSCLFGRRAGPSARRSSERPNSRPTGRIVPSSAGRVSRGCQLGRLGRVLVGNTGRPTGAAVGRCPRNGRTVSVVAVFPSVVAGHDHEGTVNKTVSAGVPLNFSTGSLGHRSGSHQNNAIGR